MSAPTIPNGGTTLYFNANQGAQVLNLQATGNPTAYTVTGLPPGLSINQPSLGKIGGTPTVPGFFTATISATNADGAGSATFYFNVGGVFPALSSTDQTATVGTPFSYQVHIAGGNASSWKANGLPPGLAISTSGVISGTPTQSGSFSVNVAAQYGNRLSNTNFDLDVALGSAGVSVADAQLNANVGTAVNFQVVIAGTYTNLTVTGLPAGLSMSSSGLITGTPTAVASAEAVVVAHNGSASASGTISFAIYAAGVVSSPADNPHLALEINLMTGEVVITNGQPEAFYGDQIIVEVDFVPADLAGNVTTASFRLKEKGEVQQYQDLLSNVGRSTDGTKFIFPVTTFAGEALLHSLLLLDEVDPSMAISYSLQFFYRWDGRYRKSSILDFTVSRPEDLDASEVAAQTTGGTPGGSISGPWSYRPELTDAIGGTSASLNAQPTVGLPFGQAIAFAYGGYGGQLAVYEWIPNNGVGPGVTSPDSITRFYPLDWNGQTNNGVWYRIL